MTRLALLGCGAHPWPSIERTRSFYLEALGQHFELVQETACGGFEPPFDAILNFGELRGWTFERHPECPLLFALHGGPVLEQDFLREHLGRLETTDVLIVNCTSDVELLGRMFAGSPPRICHLPLPVDAGRFRLLGKPECRAELPLEPTDFIVGFVARLLPQKNLHQFLRLLAELRLRLHPRTVSALVIGNYWLDYPVLDYVTAGYPQRIGRLLEEYELKKSVAYFAAGLTDEELTLCYGAMDLLVHPTCSLDENFGYAPLEAMACGTPVLGAAYGGLKDTVVSGETGFLMPTWSTDSGIRMDLLRGADEAVRLLMDEDLRARMADAGVRRAGERYSSEVCGGILCEAVSEAVAAHRRGEALPITLALPPPVGQGADLLPPIAKPWEHYRAAVSSYVSGPPPSAGPGSHLRLAAPLIPEAEGFRLDDPAWPALFCLAGRDLEIAERCRDKVSWEQLTAAGLAEPERIRHLIGIGLLLATGGEG